jgi:hypothetical protein
MSRSKAVWLALAAVLALSAVAVASASAHEFVASKEGTLKGTNNSEIHKFTTAAGTVECLKATGSGKVKGLKFKTQKVKVAYGECTTSSGTISATVSEAEFEFNAEGTVTVLNTIKSESDGCTVTVGPTGNSGLKSVTYENKSGKVNLKSNVGGITYSASSGCAGGEKTGTAGEYVGNEETELVSGTLEWK